MSYNNFLQMTTILESTAGDTWVEQVSNIIVQPIFTLILTCLTFLGFVYQLYSKKINAAGIIATLSLLTFIFGISNPRKCQYAFYLNILNWRYISCN